MRTLFVIIAATGLLAGALGCDMNDYDDDPTVVTQPYPVGVPVESREVIREREVVQQPVAVPVPTPTPAPQPQVMEEQQTETEDTTVTDEMTGETTGSSTTRTQTRRTTGGY